jgi:hypothetical protein
VPYIVGVISYIRCSLHNVRNYCMNVQLVGQVC